MTGEQNIRFGKKLNIDFNARQIKSGISAAEFKDNDALLTIFKAVDVNKNNVLDESELSLFKDKLTQAAGEDAVLNETEAKNLIKQEQKVQAEAQGAKNASATKASVKTQDLFDFVGQLQNWSKNTNVKSSTVDGDNRVINYENGAQEIISKDGSKVITLVSGGIKTVQKYSANGTLNTQEIISEEDGTEETLLYDKDGKTVNSYTVKKGDVLYNIGTEGSTKGRVLSETKGEGADKQVTTYNYTDDDNYVKTVTANGLKTVINVKDGVVSSYKASKLDENNNLIQTQEVTEDGLVKVSLYKDNKVVYDVVKGADGRTTEYSYNENGNKLFQRITTPDGKVQIAEYDGKGNTKIVVQNGETVNDISKTFNSPMATITALNKAQVYKDENGNPYFLVGDEIVVPGEYSANNKALTSRNTASQEINEYLNQEQERVVSRLQGKEQKTVNIEKDYSNWYQFATEQLVAEGVEKPTEKQKNDRVNELLILNPTIQVPKKGTSVVAIKTDADKKLEQENAIKQHSAEVKTALVTDMVSEYDQAFNSFNNQMKKDGWAADVADAVSYIWNNDLWSATGNTARQVRQDLAEYKTQLQELQTAREAGEAQFEAKFKEIFGVEYNQQKIEDYNTKKEIAEKVSVVVSSEKAIIEKMDKLFADYDTEDRRIKYSREALVDTRHLYATEHAVKQEIKQLLGLSDVQMSQLAMQLQKEGKSFDIEYCKSLYKDIKKGLAQNREKVLNGKTVDDYKADMEKAYKEAYGTKTNIVERVDKYNISQDVGAEIVKTSVKIAGSAVIAVASGGSASGLLVAALGTGVLSFGVDASDMLSDGETHEIGEYGTAAKNAVIDSAAQVVSGGMSKVLKATEAGKLARYSIQAATDLGVDLSSEYLRTGDVTWQTAVTSVLSSVGGSALGDFIESRQLARQLDLGDPVDPTYNPDAGWLGNTTDEHHRYRTDLTAEMAGNAIESIDLGNGMALQESTPRGISFDVRMSEHNSSVDDVTRLLGKKGASTDFGQGLVQLEDRFRADAPYTQTMHNGKMTPAGMVGDNVNPYGTFARNEKVKAMGLQNDVSLVQDAATISQRAYSSKDVDVAGWQSIASASADNGFNAKAYKKDGVLIIAFRGSDDVADLRVDHQILSGKMPDQFDNATKFIDEMRAKYPDAKIVVTGHSLGGGLAELSASKYEDVLGLTFDAVGTKGLVTNSPVLRDNHNTINYIVSGDIISNADAHVGTTTVVNNVVDVTTDNLHSPHAIQNFTGTADNALSGVEAGVLEYNLTTGSANRAAAQANSRTLESAIATGTTTFEDKTFRAIKEQFAQDVQGLNVDLTAMQRQVDAVTNPQQKAALQEILDRRKIAITQNTNIAGRTTVLQSMTGDEINDILARDYGFTEAGFLGGNTPSQLIEVDQTTKFVRVFNDESSFAKGSWLMPYDEVVGKSAAEIKDFYALPAMPKYIVEVEMPAGARMYQGKCNPLEGWGNGGGTQFFLIGDVRPSQYGKMVKLPE